LNKNITNEQIKRAAALIKKYKINLKTCNILGSPSESLDDALDTFRLNKEINPDFIFCSLLQPYPGTQILQYAKRINAVSIDTNADGIEFPESSYRYNPVKLNGKNEIINLQRLMYLFVKLRLPLSLVKFTIRMPLNIISYLLFKISFGYGIYKIEKLRLIPFLRFSRQIKSYV
jgi:hypothetical protein